MKPVYLNLPMIPALARRLTPLAFLVLAALLAGCAHKGPAPAAPEADRSCPPPRACPACAACPGVEPDKKPEAQAAPALQAAAWETVEGWTEDDLAAAWPALRTSCSALSRQPQWRPACDAMRALGNATSPANARQFFEQYFQPWQLTNPDGTREGLVTGYYEPVIKGSRTRSSRFAWPVHAVPEDMLTIELGDVYPEIKHLRLRGRIVGNKVMPYWTREELASRQDGIPARPLLWASDPIDLFFLQVQGSGRVELPDGKLVRIGYADQNGHPYQSIGRWLVAKGELPLEKASMEGIKRWAQENPQRLHEMLNVNPSYVFFRELPPSDGGPIGAQGVPLTAGRSIAVDTRYVPLGAPVFLATTHPLSERPLRRLMLAQDTGGAIKGVVRADFFWGLGPEAGQQAGRMRQQGRMWVLLPKGMTPGVAKQAALR